MAQINGTPGDDTLIGTPDDDQIFGFDGNDTINAGAGRDFLRGDAGVDTLDGGDGDDVAFFEGVPQGVNIDLTTGAISNDGFGNAETIFNVESLHGSFNDDVIKLGNNANGYVFGRAGNDTLIGGSGNNNLIGGSGNDTLDGKDGSDNADYWATTFDNENNTPGVNGVTVNLALGTATDNWGNTDTLINIENVSGSPYGDTITGNAAANFLNGNEGSDSLVGGDGNDVLIGGDGDDTLDGGNGDDNLQGNAGNDTLLGGDGTDFLTGGAGKDSIDGGPGSNDVAFFEDAPNGVTINLQTPVVTNDGYGNAETIVGVENLHGSWHDDFITLGNDANSYVFGRAGNDTLIGGSGNNNLIGGSGNDTLDGGLGDFDNADYSNTDFDGSTTGPTGSGVTVNLANGTALDNWGDSDTLQNIENVSGSPFGDTITGNAAANSLTGNGGNDNLAGGDGNDFLSGGDGDDTLDGGNGNDNLQGNNGNDTLFGGADDDSLRGDAGNDSLDGGDGNDFLRGDAGADSLVGGAGDDVLYGASGSSGVSLAGDGADTLDGGDGNDVIRGNAGNDTLIGGAGDDNLRGDYGNDTLNGGPGTDFASYRFDEPGQNINGISFNLSGYVASEAGTTLSDGLGGTDTLISIEVLGVSGSDGGDFVRGSNYRDEISGNGGDDNIRGNAGDDFLSGGAGNDFVRGDAGADTLFGGAGDDTLYGASSSSPVDEADDGADTIDGGDGNDVIRGNAGDDTLLGGAGNDNLRGDYGNDTLNGGSGTDVASYRFDQLSGDITFDLSGYVASDTGTLLNDGLGGIDTLISIESLLVSGAQGNDTIIGSNYSDQLGGNGGIDTLSGKGGDDNYVYVAVMDNSGTITVTDGFDTIVNDDGTGSGFDQVSFFGVPIDYIFGARVGNDLVLNVQPIVPTSDPPAEAAVGSLTIKDMFTTNPANHVDKIIFDDAHVEFSYANGVLTAKVYVGSIDGQGGTLDESTLWGLAGNDSISGTAFADQILAGPGSDFVDGGDGNDEVFGEDGDDILVGGNGADTLDGGNGNDQLYGAFGGSGNIVGGDGGDILRGGAGNDLLRGNNGNDELYGGIGDDNLRGDYGDDIIDGGDGTDFASYRFDQAGAKPGAGGINAGITFDASAVDSATTIALADGLGTTDTVVGIESIGITGSDFNDTFTGSKYQDQISGRGGDDVINAGAGDDVVSGDAGVDTLDGGDGVDTASFNFSGTVGAVTLDLSAIGPGISGPLQIEDGTGSTDTFINFERVNLVGGAAGDTLTGSQGDDTISGGGRDSDNNGTLDIDGDDVLRGGAGNDFIDGSLGNDTAVYSGNRTNYSVAVNAGELTITDLRSNSPDGTDKVQNVESFQFADGVFTLAQVSSLPYGSPTATLPNATEDTDYTITAASLLQGFGDPNGNGTLAIQNLTATNGSLTLNADGVSWTFKPDANFFSGAAVVLAYNVSDGSSPPIAATQSFSVTAVNDAPVAGNDTAANSIPLGGSIDIGVFGNDSDVDNDALTITAISAPAAGTAVIVDPVAGIVRYTSTGNLSGPVSFTYTVSDGNGGSATATVTVVVDPIRIGTAGPDVINGTTADDEIRGLAGNDTLDGKAGNDLIYGGDGDDSIIGGTGDDTLYGDAGDDTITGGDGVDVAMGGTGNDVFVISGTVLATEQIGGGDGTDSLRLSANATLSSGSILSSIEQLDLGANNTLSIATTDLIDFSSMTLAGSGQIVGDGQNNRINGTLGNDVLVGGAGADILAGGNGADLFIASGSELNGDVLTGGGGADTLQFGSAITLNQGFVVASDIETLDMGKKSVTVTTTAPVDFQAIATVLNAASFSGDAAANSISGTQGADVINGNGGNDTLRGAGGNDQLYGNDGADLLFGGAGNDQLYGATTAKKGDGASDVFVFNTALGPNNVDTIFAFEATNMDKIALDTAIFAGIGFTGPNGSLTGSNFASNAGGNPTAGGPQILFDTSTGNLFFDSDGTGVAAKVLFATLNGTIGTVDASDFVNGSNYGP